MTIQHKEIKTLPLISLEKSRASGKALKGTQLDLTLSGEATAFLEAEAGARHLPNLTSPFDYQELVNEYQEYLTPGTWLKDQASEWAGDTLDLGEDPFADSIPGELNRNSLFRTALPLLVRTGTFTRRMKSLDKRVEKANEIIAALAGEKDNPVRMNVTIKAPHQNQTIVVE